MKLRPLPLIEEINSLPPDQAAARTRALYSDFFASPASQLVADLLRQYERQAMTALHSTELSPEKVQRMLGRIQLIEDLRHSLTSMVSQSESATFAEADEESEIFLEKDLYASIPSRHSLPVS